MFNIHEYAEGLRRAQGPLLKLPSRITCGYIRENVTRLGNTKAVLWDIYGTLMRTASGDLELSLKKKQHELAAF